MVVLMCLVHCFQSGQFQSLDLGKFPCWTPEDTWTLVFMQYILLPLNILSCVCIYNIISLNQSSYFGVSLVQQSYTHSLPSSLLAPPVQPLREYDLPFSSLLTTQSMPTKYNTSPSIGGSISMPEVLYIF